MSEVTPIEASSKCLLEDCRHNTMVCIGHKPRKFVSGYEVAYRVKRFRSFGGNTLDIAELWPMAYIDGRWPQFGTHAKLFKSWQTPVTVLELPDTVTLCAKLNKNLETSWEIVAITGTRLGTVIAEMATLELAVKHVYFNFDINAVGFGGKDECCNE